ncbi:MAG: hypothetical protein L0Z70_14530, partial [Chloroflexi bacterium]|nr:hypothetical protein [Chloroflexota bacterium]
MRRANAPEGGKAAAPPVALRAANWLLDTLLSRMRWLLVPFRWLTWLGEAAGRGVWLLSNEYSKRSFGGCGVGVRIHGRFYVSGAKQLFIEDNVHINQNAFLRAEGGLHIGANTHISRNLV